MGKKDRGVYIVVNCDSILALRHLIKATEFPDSDNPINHEIISTEIEDLLMCVIDHVEEIDSMYNVFIDEILMFLSNYLNVISISSIRCISNDTVLIHCSPLGVLNGNSSKD